EWVDNPRPVGREWNLAVIPLKIVKVAGRWDRGEDAWRRRRRERMKAGQGGKWLILAALWLPAGCALPKQAKLERALASDRGPATHTRDLEEAYTVRCPDVLEIRVEGRPVAGGARTVGSDGCIVLEPGRRLRIDGMTTPRIKHAVARELDLPGMAVQVRVS